MKLAFAESATEMNARSAREGPHSDTKGFKSVTVIAKAVTQLLMLLALAVPLTGQDIALESRAGLGVAQEYVVPMRLPEGFLNNGVGVRLYTDARISPVWSIQFSVRVDRHAGNGGYHLSYITDSGEWVAPPKIHFFAYSFTLGPQVRQQVMNGRLGVSAAVAVGVSVFSGGDESQPAEAQLLGVVLEADTRLYKKVWLTFGSSADYASFSYSSPGMVDSAMGVLARFHLGFAVPI